MLFRFSIGRSRSGGIGFRSTLIYYMPFWEVVCKERHKVEYRPTGETFVHLGKLSLMAIFVLGCLVWYSGFPWSASPADAASSVFETIGSILYWLVFTALVAVAVLPIAGFPLQRLTLERTEEDQFVIRKRGLWPTTRSWPNEAFGQIIFAVEEETSRYRHVTTTIGWLWMVKLRVSPQFVMEHGPSLVDDPEIVFHIDRQKDRPTDLTRPPRSVRVLIKHLRRLTGIRQVGHTEIESEKRGFFGRRRKYVTRTTSAPVVQKSVYHSADDAPEHLRGEVRRILERARSGDPASHRSLRVTIRDSDGNERTYTSLEEMPADVRRRYEDAVRSAGRQGRDDS